MIIHVLLDEIGEREAEGGTDLDSFNNNCRDIGLRIVKSQYYMNWRKFNLAYFLINVISIKNYRYSLILFLGETSLSLYRLYNILEEKKERKGMNQHLSSSVKTYQKNRERYLIHK